MKLKDYKGLIERIREVVEDAIAYSLSNYVSFYVDPETCGWYEVEKVNESAMPIAVWEGHDKELITISEEYYIDDCLEMAVADILTGEELEVIGEELVRDYEDGTLKEKYPTIDWIAFFDSYLDYEVFELQKTLDNLGIEYDD